MICASPARSGSVRARFKKDGLSSVLICGAAAADNGLARSALPNIRRGNGRLYELFHGTLGSNEGLDCFMNPGGPCLHPGSRPFERIYWGRCRGHAWDDRGWRTSINDTWWWGIDKSLVLRC